MKARVGLLLTTLFCMVVANAAARPLFPQPLKWMHGDTFFEDTETHFPAGTGFFYLTSVVSGNEKGGVGTTSTGLPRLPTEPCP